MDIKSIFHIDDDDKTSKTFKLDEKCPALPLPKLDDTLDRYYRNLLPFGTDEELKNSKKLIEDYRNGMGRKMHTLLEKKAANEKNWVDEWWQRYAYMVSRTPLLPDGSMAQPLILGPANVEESKCNSLKSLAKILSYNFDLWNLVRHEKLKPAKTPSGETLSSYLWRRFFNTVRVPGEIFDEVVCHFKTLTEGKCPSHMNVIGNGRIFSFNTVDSHGNQVSPQAIYHALHLIKTKIEHGGQPPLVPLLTCDERTNWAKNREHLLSLSENNRNIIRMIEESISCLSLDSHEPNDYEEAGQKTMAGDFHSRWADKSSIFVQFQNGFHGCIGEHACYDGTVSMSFDVFIQLSCLENPEPDWDEVPKELIKVVEYQFDVDDHILSQIKTMEGKVPEMQHKILLKFNEFQHFGKNFLKKYKIHPDAFVQLALQLTYYKLHNEFAPTYETALLRAYYKGRTETVRSCSKEVADWVKAMVTTTDLKNEWNLFKVAIDSQNRLMKEAREGNGYDRHLFALWCAAYENGDETHPMFTDPMFAKSGGNGNFVLSTSLLGYTINIGCVAPMVKDGYGAFYSITNNEIYTVISTFRDSFKTSGTKYTKELEETLLDMRSLIELAQSHTAPPSKL